MLEKRESFGLLRMMEREAWPDGAISGKTVVCLDLMYGNPPGYAAGVAKILPGIAPALRTLGDVSKEA